MWYALLWRVLSWFTWTHIQWLMVACLGPRGLEFSLDRMISNITHDNSFLNKAVGKMTVADIKSHLESKP
jgi:hypothetical protein